MARKTIYFSADSLLNLLTHYSSGDLPIDAELVSAGVSPLVNRWIGLEVKSDQWRDAQETKDGGLVPLHIRYEGKKVLVWGDGDLEEHPTWRNGQGAL